MAKKNWPLTIHYKPYVAILVHQEEGVNFKLQSNMVTVSDYFKIRFLKYNDEDSPVTGSDFKLLSTHTSFGQDP